MGFEPTTLRDLVGCSNHLSYWRLYTMVSKGQFVEKRSLKKIRASTGFEPLTSALPVRCSTN